MGRGEEKVGRREEEMGRGDEKVGQGEGTVKKTWWGRKGMWGHGTETV